MRQIKRLNVCEERKQIELEMTKEDKLDVKKQQFQMKKQNGFQSYENNKGIKKWRTKSVEK